MLSVLNHTRTSHLDRFFQVDSSRTSHGFHVSVYPLVAPAFLFSWSTWVSVVSRNLSWYRDNEGHHMPSRRSAGHFWTMCLDKNMAVKTNHHKSIMHMQQYSRQPATLFYAHHFAA